jgi:hypothetical protein
VLLNIVPCNVYGSYCKGTIIFKPHNVEMVGECEYGMIYRVIDQESWWYHATAIGAVQSDGRIELNYAHLCDTWNSRG